MQLKHRCDWHYWRPFAVCQATVCVTVFLALLSTAHAGPYDPPASYYNGATGTGPTLKVQLTDAMSAGHIQRTYGDFRYSAAITDQDPNNPSNILLVYNRASVTGVWTTSPTLIWNREHVWPQAAQPGSASNGVAGNLGDPHALRPANPAINSNRGNLPFGFDASTGSHRSLGSYYFPGDVDKGDIARQMFYSDTRYSASGLSLTDSFPSGNQMGDLSSLIAWHYLDAPDEFEQRRNHAISSSDLNPTYYTNNRNAYIDHPEFVWSVYVDQQNDSQIAISGVTVDGDGGSTSQVSLGRVLVGAAVPAPQTVTLNKSGNDGTYFNVVTSSLATSTVVGRYNAFRTGATDSTTLDVGLNTNTIAAGGRSGSIMIDNLDVTSGGGAGRAANDADDAINVSLDVLDHANPSFAGGSDLNAFTHDFGSIALGSAAPTFSFDLFNLENSAAFTASLDLDSIIAIGDASTFTTDLTLFSGASSLEADSNSSFTASLDTSTAGSFAVVYTLSFSDEDLPGASNVGQLEFSLLGTVEEQAVETADFDQDIDVDGGDLLIWQRGLFTGTLLAEGDANGDLNVDGLDLAVWERQFGGSQLAGRTRAVPEPSSVAYCLAVSMLLLKRREFSPFSTK